MPLLEGLRYVSGIFHGPLNTLFWVLNNFCILDTIRKDILPIPRGLMHGLMQLSTDARGISEKRR